MLSKRVRDAVSAECSEDERVDADAVLLNNRQWNADSDSDSGAEATTTSSNPSPQLLTTAVTLLSLLVVVLLVVIFGLLAVLLRADGSPVHRTSSPAVVVNATPTLPAVLLAATAEPRPPPPPPPPPPCPSPTVDSFALPGGAPLSDILVGVVTFGERQDRTVPAVAATWGRHFPRIRYFSNTTARPGASYEITPMPLLADGGPRDYGEMNTVYQDPASPWYYKCDDDTFVHPQRLASLLDGLDSDDLHFIGSHIYQPQWPHNYCHGGTGYLISNGLMRRMHPHLLEKLQADVSDVQVGHIAARFNVSCLHVPDAFGHEFEHYLTPDVWADQAKMEETLAGMASAITFHHITPERMAVYEFALQRLVRQVQPFRPFEYRDFNLKLWASYPPNFIRPHNSWPDLAKFPAREGMRRGSLVNAHRWDGHCGLDGYHCVVAFSLVSDSPELIATAKAVSTQVPYLFPLWQVRFYHNASVPEPVLQELRELKADVRLFEPKLLGLRDEEAVGSDWWPLAVALDGSANRWLIRSLDTERTQAEWEQVRNWMESAYSTHRVRDDGRPGSIHSWGGVHRAVSSELVTHLMQSSSTQVWDDVLFPAVQLDCLTHHNGQATTAF